MNKTRQDYLKMLKQHIENEQNEKVNQALINYYNDIIDYENSIEKITKATTYYKKQYKSFINAFEKIKLKKE